MFARNGGVFYNPDMPQHMATEYSYREVSFLLETVQPSLLSKVDTIRGDPSIVEGILEQESEKLVGRLMSMGEEELLSQVSPRFLFEVLLWYAVRQLRHQRYTFERTADHDLPVFDADKVVRFLSNRSMVRYLADMLSSFTRIESISIPIRVRKGVWRRVRFNDMDVDSLVRLCEVAKEGERFAYYKRIADVCLFILGVFPEHVHSDFRAPLGEIGARTPRRLRRSAEDYEEDGRRFYRMAAEQEEARASELDEVLWLLHEDFDLARKPLDFISRHCLYLHRQKLFPTER